jgi:DNA-binding sugar fermentation-stimulating protein
MQHSCLFLSRLKQDLWIRFEPLHAQISSGANSFCIEDSSWQTKHTSDDVVFSIFIKEFLPCEVNIKNDFNLKFQFINKFIYFENIDMDDSKNFIYTLPQKMILATVLHRPSKINKSPYLADIIIDSGSGASEISIAHSPSLGCGGLICSGVKVYVVPCESKTKDKNVSKYILYHIENKEKISPTLEISHSPICAHPNMANIIVGKMLEKKMIIGLEDLTHIKAETSVTPLVKIENFNEDCVLENEKTCRFDFSGMLNDSSGRSENILIEVKCVPLADYVDVLPKIRTKTLSEIKPENKKLKAIFPYGTARKYELVSPRALKHIKNLEAYTLQKGYKTFMIYVSMRDDVEAIKISEIDTEYRKAVFAAKQNGVNLLGYSIRWDEEKAYVNSKLPVI